jgi:predicted amidohydrolase
MRKLFALIGLIVFTTLVLATPQGPPYNNRIPPKLPMISAYELALKQMVAVTNQCYCVSANITTDFNRPAWSFRFCTTNVYFHDIVMVVRFDGTVYEDNEFR